MVGTEMDSWRRIRKAVLSVGQIRRKWRQRRKKKPDFEKPAGPKLRRGLRARFRRLRATPLWRRFSAHDAVTVAVCVLGIVAFFLFVVHWMIT